MKILSADNIKILEIKQPKTSPPYTIFKKQKRRDLFPPKYKKYYPQSSFISNIKFIRMKNKEIKIKILDKPLKKCVPRGQEHLIMDINNHKIKLIGPNSPLNWFYISD